MLIPAASVVALVAGAWRVARALRAKERLRTRVKIRLKEDHELQEFKARAAKGTLSAQDLAAVHEILQKLAYELPESDRKSVERSLHQPSKAGERRYISEMLAAA